MTEREQVLRDGCLDDEQLYQMLKQRAQRAEAACAEMRVLIERSAPNPYERFRRERRTDMTPEAQRLALAKWAGLEPQDIPLVPAKANLKGWFTPDGSLAIYNTYPHGSSVRVIPDYLHDLNAVHELEEKLGSVYADYEHYLFRAMMESFERKEGSGLWPIWHATSAQRCEALLRTLGLWEA